MFTPRSQPMVMENSGVNQFIVAKEGEAEGEHKGKKVYNDANPYAYDPNEVQEDEEGVFHWGGLW